ncbi:hypothetical protein EG329_006213 [Mollisiaceae sp. DMI_Dod_QoI]|nr:hypothetical protein EG329_006213 [Helotiales sp. DMI_Dod_QoI]
MNLLTLVTFLITLLSFSTTSGAKSLQVRDGSGFTSLTGLPAGYTWSKLRYTTTINGQEVVFEGDHRQHIFEQVKAQNPDFQIPVLNATKVKEIQDKALLQSHQSGFETRSDVFGGDGWHAYCIPVPSQPWTPANQMNLYVPLYTWQGDPVDYYTVRAKSCALWSCVLGAGWTICNDSDHDTTTTDDGWTYYGFILMDNCGTVFNDYKSANGGQIFNEAGGYNMIAAANWGSCYGEDYY